MWVFRFLPFIAILGLNIVFFNHFRSANTPQFLKIENLTDVKFSETQNGSFLALSYNVAGLPQAVSQSRPRENIPQIGPKLNDFELVLIQEDFWYPHQLRANLKHPFQSMAHKIYLKFNDGLSLFASFPIQLVKRVGWQNCHGSILGGSDCLANKGFIHAIKKVGPNQNIHIYNIHLDAGRFYRDSLSRHHQLNQLKEYIEKNSKDQAVIIGGDFNLKLKEERDRATFNSFIRKLNLKDACHTHHCNQERLDRFLFKSGSALKLDAKSWQIAKGFKNLRGKPLSDHDPIQVEFSYQPRPQKVASINK